MARKKIKLTDQDQAIFAQVRKTGNLDLFTNHYFRTEFSGTRYNQVENAENYPLLHEAWQAAGKPDVQWKVTMDGQPVTMRVLWEDSEPTFLYNHGFLFLPWVKNMYRSGRPIIVIEGGTGCGKTSNIGLFALTMCALHEAYEFLNVAPTATQASDMNTEIEKWVIGTEFERFVIRARSGQLFKQRPYPEMKVNTGNKHNSLFGCMTLGQQGHNILGKGRDWINVDEAGLLPDIATIIPKLVTRLRGRRTNHKPRDGRMSFISNPHAWPAWRQLVKRAAKLAAEDSRYFFARPKIGENPTITEDQLELQRDLMDPADIARWHDGDASSIEESGEFPLVLMEMSHGVDLDALMEDLILQNDSQIRYETRDGVGAIHWELPTFTGAFVTIGDPGQANKRSMRDNNVPVVMSFDVTHFPLGPARMVACHLIDGRGRYQPWKEHMMQCATKFPGLVAYDATATQVAFVEDEFFKGIDLWPVSLGGGVKPLAKTLLKMFMGDGMISMPFLDALWYEAAVYREYGPGVKKLPDDMMCCLIILAYVLRAVYSGELGNKYRVGHEQTPEENVIENAIMQLDRYSRHGLRYGGRR